MSAVRCLLLVLAGCGRFGFGAEERPDARVCLAPVGHDEDGDAIDDACDGCPHVADPTQPDGDRDGVDDSCDPRPDIPGDSIVFFDPFVVQDPSWMVNGIVGTYVDDGVHADARNTNRYLLRRPHTPSDDTFILGGAVMGAVSLRQLTLGTQSSDPSYYYCEIQGGTNAAKLAITYTLDSSNYMVLSRSDGAVFENGTFELSFHDASPSVGCATTWDVPLQSLTATLPASFPTNRVGIEVSSMDVLLQYFVQIHSE